MEKKCLIFLLLKFLDEKLHGSKKNILEWIQI